jgi:AcrR family transcriptional regulator
MSATRLTRVERSNITRRELLATAQRHFLRDGYHGATLDAIADDAGYTKGALYCAYRSKADLFLALFDTVIEERLAELRATRARGACADELAAARVLGPIVERDSRFLLLAIEFWTHASHDPKLLEEFSARYRRLRSKLAEFGASDGTLGRESRAIATLALSSGLALERLIDPDDVPRDLMRTLQSMLGR